MINTYCVDDFMYLDSTNERYNVEEHGTKGAYFNYLVDMINHDFDAYNGIQLTLLFGTISDFFFPKIFRFEY